MATRPNAEGKQQKRGPEFMIKLPSQPSRLRRDTPFICNIRFKNDLPEVPCDPKMLLPPFNAGELAAFGLTSLEREMKRDMLFEPDLGIPISMLDIGRYTVPYRSVAERPPLDPKDAALLKDDEGEGGGVQRTRLRGAAAELSWLIRTKYISNEGSEQEKRRRAAAEAAARRAAAEGLEPEGQEGAIAAIERTFEAAQQAPVHPTNPSLVPLDVLPVFPDEELEGRQLVQAFFDNDPVADLERMQRLPEAERRRLVQASHLKSYQVMRRDKPDKFVAYLVPYRLREERAAASEGGPVPAEAQQADYEWVREYDQKVKASEEDKTFLFRFAGDYVGYSDLNTKLHLRKRKRQQFDLDEEEAFAPPERIVLRLPGNTELEDLEEEAEAAGAGGRGSPAGRRGAARGGGGGGEGMSPELGPAGDLGEDGGGGGGEPGSPEVAQQQEVLRDVFGDEDDDD